MYVGSKQKLRCECHILSELKKTFSLGLFSLVEDTILSGYPAPSLPLLYKYTANFYSSEKDSQCQGIRAKILFCFNVVNEWL